jgi:glycosyltransferase involved in cell wall biosynthesis
MIEVYRLMTLFSFLFGFLTAHTSEEKPIVVLTTTYNNRKWAKKNVSSIFKQDYSNYRVIYIDDASQDGTADLVEKWVNKQKKKPRFELIRNRERAGALANIYRAICDHCSDEEIVVSLDGDDWFYDTKVLKKINQAYSAREVWLTHGTLLEFPAGTTGWSLPIPPDIVARNAFRSYRCPSHLRTFYAWLFKRIRLEDLQHKGEFFSMTWDQAMMFPMIEMAGERHAFISEINYVYNMSNPLNDNKVDPQLQRDLEALIRTMPPYQRLNKALPCQEGTMSFQSSINP